MNPLRANAAPIVHITTQPSRGSLNCCPAAPSSSRLMCSPVWAARFRQLRCHAAGALHFVLRWMHATPRLGPPWSMHDSDGRSYALKITCLHPTCTELCCWIRITHKEVDAPIDGLGKDEILSDWFESSESGSSPKEHEPDLDASLMLERQIRTIAVQPAGLMSTKELCTPVVQLSSPQDKLFRGCDSAAGQIQSLMRPSGRWLLAGAGTLLLFALSALSLSALGCAGLSCALTRMGEHEVMAPVSMLDESNTMLDSMFESPLRT